MVNPAPSAVPTAIYERSQIVMFGGAGLVPYQMAAAWQECRAEAVANGSAPEMVLFLQHPPVFTMGRRGGRQHLRTSESDLAQLGVQVIDADRGGDITFHGPGQLVLWPILRLRERGIGVVSFVRRLESAAIEIAGHFGFEARTIKGRPGVWTTDPTPAKLASIGIRIQNGVSRHGMAINVDPDLRWFDHITACGIEEARVSSLSEQMGRDLTVEEVIPVAAAALSEAFGLRLAPARLEIVASS